MRIILIAVLLTFQLGTSFGQMASAEIRSYPVTGVVIDETGERIPFATIAVFNSGDSTILTGEATNIDGEFRIMLEEGLYDMEVTFLSYQSMRLTNIRVERGGKDLGEITLTPRSTELEEVLVSSERGQMQLKLDKRVFNVDKDMSNIGGNAADILDNLPSITVDVEGNVSLRGSESVRILIDGKPSGLVGISSTEALRQLQGDIIERIEVITNPSARYDAEGQVGIINIVLKKDRRDGLNGSFQLTTGYPHNHSASASVNYRKKKINLFTNIGLNYRSTPGMGATLQEFNTADTSFFFQQDREHLRSDFSQNINVGFDWFVSEADQITIAGLMRRGDGVNETTNTYRDFNSLGEQTNQVLREDTETEFDLTTELSLAYRHDFPQEERTFTADFKVIDSKDRENAMLTQSSTQSSDITDQRADNVEDERNMFMQADYVHPFDNGGRFEAGWRSSLRYIQNTFLVEELDSEGDWNTVGVFDNDMRYDEFIHAAYMIYGQQVKSFSYQLGLRAEHSDITTELLKTNERNPRKYTNLFPSAHVTYELDGKDQWQLSYSRRISRPRFRHLLPFYSFSDNRRQWTGNPDLDPEFTSSIEAGYLKYFEKGSILSTIYYRHTTGVIERLVAVDSLGFTSVRPVNLSEEDSYGFEFNISYDPWAWWNVNANLNIFRSHREGTYEGQTLTADVFSGSGRVSSRWTIIDRIDVQTNVNYRAPQNTTQGKRKAVTSVDFSAAMDILEGKGTIAFNIRDVFNSRIWRWDQSSEGYYTTGEFQWRQRQFLLNFSYRLNKKKDNREGGGMNGGEMDFGG